jgi:hypothetical protein
MLQTTHLFSLVAKLSMVVLFSLILVNPAVANTDPYATLPTLDGVIGPINAPGPTQAHIASEDDSSAQIPGFLLFISRLLQYSSVVAGIWVLFNATWAGLLYIQGADAKSMDKVRGIITNSVIGLLLIVTAYTIAALVGLLVFGDASFIISPRLDKTIVL